MATALDRKSTRLNSSHTVIYTLSLHDALPISITPWSASSPSLRLARITFKRTESFMLRPTHDGDRFRSEEHTSELQSHSDLHSFPTRRSSDLNHTLVRIQSELEARKDHL